MIRCGRLMAQATMLFGMAAAGMAEPDLSGDWEGVIQTPGPALNILLTFTSQDEGWAGVIDIPQQSTQDLPLSAVEVRGDSVLFGLPGVPGDPRFAGVVSAEGAALAGDFTQSGTAMTFSVRRVDAEAAATALAVRLQELTAFIDTARTSWEVPGLAIAIVKDGEAVYARGFGLRNVEKELPVTENTLFAIGSTTKAMTSTGIAMLTDDGLVDWDERVRTYLPAFELMDEVLAQRMTVRDLVTHRSGLPRHDMLWYGAPHSRQELFGRLRHLEASRDLRQTFQYNNLMYMTAGYLAGQVTGGTWEEFMRQRLLEPLGMTGSNLSVTTSQETADHALPYGERDGEVVAIPFRDIDAIGPAGSVNSSAVDMAKWLRFNLDGGTVGERRLISGAALQDVHASHMVMPGQPNPDDLAYTSYGLGWMVASYRGHYRLEHGGGIDGFITSVVLLPHDGLGVAVMANHGGTPLPDVVARHATDLLLELEPIDWHGQRKQAAAAAGGDTEDVPLPGTRFAHPLADYRGEYEHPGYGVITIRAEDDALTLSYNTFSTPLEHFHYETFRAAGPDLEDTKITFHTNAGGEVAWLATGLEAAVDDIEFAHKPVVREHVVKRAPGPIEVDGRLDDAAWKKAAWTEDFVVHDTGAPTDRRTRARMLWTDTHWYLAWSIDDPGLAAELTEHDSNVWQEDSVELFIDPDGDERNYLQVVVSALGTVMDHSVSRASRAGVISDTDWTLEGLQVGVQVDGSVGDHGDKDKRWTCELAVPFAAIESASPAMSFPPVDGDAWRVNLYRTDRDLRDDDDTTLHTAWSRTDRRGYHAPDRFGRVVFSAEVAD